MTQPLPNDGEVDIKDQLRKAHEMLTEWLVDHGTGSDDPEVDDPANYFENIDPVIDHARALVYDVLERLCRE